MENKTTDEEILTMLKSKTFWDSIVIDEMNKKIVGEIASREILFLCGIGSLVKNSSYSSFNTLIHSESSAGKDYTTKNVLKLFPQPSVFSRTRISPTVLNYWKPYERIGKSSWDGCILYLPDIGEFVINSDALKLMCSDGSHITITDKGEARDIEIKGKPIIFTTTANSTPNEEMINRFSIVHLDETEDQTKKILSMCASRAEEGITSEYDSKVLEAISLLERHSVKIPFARKISEVFPTGKLRERRNFDRFLDFIKAMAVFHQFQREKDDKIIIAEWQDYDKVRDIFMNLQCGVNSIPLNRKQKEIISVLTKLDEPTQLSEIHKKMEIYIAMKNLRPYLESLVNLRIVDKQYGTDSLNREVMQYNISDEYTSYKPIKLPTSQEIISGYDTIHNNTTTTTYNTYKIIQSAGGA